MATATTRAMALIGVEGAVVEVEADAHPGLPTFNLVGLPDTALSEARDRVRAAIRNSGLPFPQGKVTLNLTPAALPKRGATFDLACAAAILATTGVPLDRGLLAGSVLFGELGLDGRVRAGAGVLPAALAAHRAGFRQVVVPRANVTEARLVDGLAVTGVSSLRGLVAHLARQPLPDDDGAEDSADPVLPDADRRLDLAEVLGQDEARWAVEVAAAGGHHLLLNGPPGAGKTMLAERLPTVMPPLTRAEALEVSAIHSVAGQLAGGRLLTSPPYRIAHHSASAAALVGGGSGQLKVGLVSLSHRGVLFLDEAPEFSRNVLDALREPLESGEVTISRSGIHQMFPAKFTLVMAANPCPCAGIGGGGDECTCGSAARRRYYARISGPLLDRVDLRPHVPAVGVGALAEGLGRGESSASVAARVLLARERMSHRLQETPWTRMADVPSSALRERWPLDLETLQSAYDALDRGRLTARGFDRTLRVAWTMADLRGLGKPGRAEVVQALRMRGLHVAKRAAA